MNSARGNKLFDISDPTDLNYKGTAHANAPMGTAVSDSWEPPGAIRGDIARALFYMAVRYAGDTAAEPELKLTDRLSLVSNGTNYMGRLTTLLRWHQLDPVDDPEQLRNDRIFTIFQHNRNPFVDRPELAMLTFHPTLAVRVDGNAVSLSWNVEFPDAQAETATGLVDQWSTVSTVPVLNNEWRLRLPSIAPVTFYRLKLR